MSEMAWESFTGAFTGMLEFDWERENSPTVVANKIDGFSRNLNDMTLPLGAARQIVVDDIREHFEREESPEGVPWKDWAKSYQDRAQAENVGILRKTEDLVNAVTDPQAYPIIGDDLWAISNDWPDYWAVHNYGALDGRIPQREYLGTSEEAQLAVVDIFDKWIDAEITLFFSPMTGFVQEHLPGGLFGGRVGLRSTPVGRPRLNPGQFIEETGGLF